MTVVELATLGTVAGVGFAIFVAAIGAALAFGKLSQRVIQMDVRFDGIDSRIDGIDDRIDGIDDRLDRIENAINELRMEIQQTNRILVGLANHRHDTDGNTVFTIPQA